VLDPNPMPPGLYQYSVIVSTPSREMKFTAPTKERHDIWLNVCCFYYVIFESLFDTLILQALNYLLARPGPLPNAPPGNNLQSPMSATSELPDEENQPNLMTSPKSRRSGRSGGTGFSGDSWNNTPKGQRSQSQISLRGSMGKRSGTPAAEYLRWAERGGPYSPTRSYERVGQQDDELDFELHDGNMSDGGFEGLENVRACCDGRHTVGHHHHHHHHDPSNHEHARQPGEISRTQDRHLDVSPRDISRPVSPAWSFRSRNGSTHSKEGQSIFSRFGSRRSAKTPVNGEGPHDR
jgi:Meiotic cell cortex C-terminal pleckstrin homology